MKTNPRGGPRSISTRAWRISIIAVASLVTVVCTMFWAAIVTDQAVQRTNSEIEKETLPMLEVASHAYKAEIALAGTFFGPPAARPFTMLAYKSELLAADALIADLKTTPGLVLELDLFNAAVDHWETARTEAALAMSVEDPVAEPQHVLAAFNSLTAAAEGLEQASALAREEAIESSTHAKAVRDRGAKAALAVAMLGLLFGGLLIKKLTRDISGPLEALRLGAGEVADGKDSYVRVSNAPVELMEVADSFNLMVGKLRKREAALLRLAYFDPLTGLGNRATLHQQLDLSLGRLQRRQGQAFALILLDLDRFKDLNDALGHSVGDEVLVIMAERIKSCLHRAETVCRLSGDEFTIITENVSDGASKLADQLVDAIGQPLQVSGHSVLVRASAGITFAVTGNETNEELLRDADLAMYDAKAAGGNTSRVFDSKLLNVATNRLQVAKELRTALSVDEFEVHYQPLVDLETRKVVGAEALVRWRHPVRGTLGPFEFLDIAEDNGLIIPIGERVLSVALKDSARWRKKYDGLADFKMSVNVSANQIRLPDFVNVVESALSRASVDPQHLCLELTETALLGASNDIDLKLQSLRSRGVCIALDDFGTGFSSLHLVNTLTVDTIKIDRSFVTGISERSELRALVSSIIELAAAFGRAVVAEGIESEEDAETIRSLGGTVAQGYWFGRPVPASDFEQSWLTGQSVLDVGSAVSNSRA